MENKKFRSGSCFAKRIVMLPDRFLFQDTLVTRLFTYKTVRPTTIFNFQFTQETFLSPQLHRHDTTGLRFHALLPLRCGIFAFHRIPTTPVSYASAMKNNQTQGNNFPTFRMRSFFCNICYCGTKSLPHSENPTHSPFSSTDRCRTFSACIFAFSDLP